MGTRPGYAAEASGVKSRHSRKRDGETRRFSIHGASCRFLFLAFFAYFAVSSHAQNLDSLSHAIQSGTIEQKREALFQIRNLRSEPASRIALPALKDADPIVRATAAASVVFLPKPETVGALALILTDDDAFVRKETAFALGSVKSSDSASVLIAALEREKDLEVKSALVVALGYTGNLSAVEPLISLMKAKPKEETEFLRRSAARSIGQIAQILKSSSTYTVTPESFLPDKYKAKDGGNITRQFPIFKSSVTILSEVLRSREESDDTRREAAFALGTIGDKTAFGLLESHKNSPDPYLAEICKEALLKMKAPE